MSKGEMVPPPYTLALKLLAWSRSSSAAIAERWTSSGPSARRKVRVKAYLDKRKEQGWRELPERNRYFNVSHSDSNFCSLTKAVIRKRAEGKSKKEAHRLLKCHFKVHLGNCTFKGHSAVGLVSALISYKLLEVATTRGALLGKP